jgi:hypothetical protein
MENKKRLLIILAVIFILAVISFFIFFKREIPTCNDGTAYNQCSGTKPYFCSNGILVEQVSTCGCNELTEIHEDKCILKYQDEPKNIVLNYTLNGKLGKINFTVYKNLSDYLSNTPRYIAPSDGKEATLLDFKLKSIDEENQKKFLLPLVIAIQNSAKNKDDQARIAVSIVQNIPFGSTNKTLKFGDIKLDYYRYPYEVLYDMQGVCGEKSELLSFLLREIGYDNAFFYFPKENHEAVGIKCPVKKSFNSTGYCFIETTGPSIITDSKTEYITIGQIDSFPEIIPIDGYLTFGENSFYEYGDAKTLDTIRQDSRDYGAINYIQHFQFRYLVQRYGLVTFEERF